MAKSIHINDMEKGNSFADPLTGSFWEHWFEKHDATCQAPEILDEHSIWEKAISIGIFSLENKKV